MKFLYKKNNNKKADLAIIMCTYKRLENLPKTYKNLGAQTSNNFDFYICDNSGNDPHLLNTTKKSLRNYEYNVFIKEYNNKYSIFSRFFLAKEIAKENYKMIVFIDDDQIIPDSFVQDCYDQYEEDTIKSFYAYFIDGDYWRKTEVNLLEDANYLGGGGLLCNPNLFLDENFFSCPEKYYILDDLWVSYYVANFTNYKMKKLKTGIKFIIDDKATAKGLKQMKRDFSDKYIMKNGIIK